MFNCLEALSHFGECPSVVKMAASSFKKKVSSKTNYPRGTRPSFHNSSLLLSTGVPSLDALLGMYPLLAGSAMMVYQYSYLYMPEVQL